MKKTEHYKGHRWTQEEIKILMRMWTDGEPAAEIAAELKVTPRAVLHMVVRLRQQGIPLARRVAGAEAGRSNKLWTQAEVEYLIRRRKERATMDQIAHDLDRTALAVQGMIQQLRRESVPVPMFGNGVRRLYDVNTLTATFRNLPPRESSEEMLN